MMDTENNEEKRKEEQISRRLSWSLYAASGVGLLQIVLFTFLFLRLLIRAAEWIDWRIAKDGRIQENWVYPRPGSLPEEKGQSGSWSEYTFQYGIFLFPSVFSTQGNFHDNYNYGAQIWRENEPTVCHTIVMIFLGLHFLLAIFMGVKLINGLVTRNLLNVRAWIVMAVYFLLLFLIGDFALIVGLVIPNTFGSVRLLLVFLLFSLTIVIGIHIVCVTGNCIRKELGIVDEVEGDSDFESEGKRQSLSGKGEDA